MAIVKNNGLSVNPPKSLMKNIGLSNGTHFSAWNKILGKHPFDVEIVENQKIIFEDNLEENKQALGLLKKFYYDMSQRKRAKILYFLLRQFQRLTPNALK